MGMTAAAPSACAHPLIPLTTGRRERAGGNDENPKTLTGCLRGGVKADIHALKCLHAVSHWWLFTALLGVDSVLEFNMAAEGLLWDFGAFSLISPHQGTL